MRLDSSEITAIASELAPKVAAIIERHLEERPEWAMSVPEAAAWASVPEHTIRDAIASGRLSSVKVGHQVRIKRCDLFVVRNGDGATEGNGE